MKDKIYDITSLSTDVLRMQLATYAAQQNPGEDLFYADKLRPGQLHACTGCRFFQVTKAESEILLPHTDPMTGRRATQHLVGYYVKCYGYPTPYTLDIDRPVACNIKLLQEPKRKETT